MSRLRRLWRGELPLISAFWDWAVIGGIIVNASTSILFFVLLMNGHPVAAFILGYVFSVPYNVLAAVGVWRSADRYPGNRRLADAAKYGTAVVMAVVSMT